MKENECVTDKAGESHSQRNYVAERGKGYAAGYPFTYGRPGELWSIDHQMGWLHAGIKHEQKQLEHLICSAISCHLHPKTPPFSLIACQNGYSFFRYNFAAINDLSSKGKERFCDVKTLSISLTEEMSGYLVFRGQIRAGSKRSFRPVATAHFQPFSCRTTDSMYSQGIAQGASFEKKTLDLAGRNLFFAIARKKKVKYSFGRKYILTITWVMGIFASALTSSKVWFCNFSVMRVTILRCSLQRSWLALPLDSSLNDGSRVPLLCLPRCDRS